MRKRNVDMRESLRMFDKVGNEFLRNAIELVSLLSRKLAPIIGNVSRSSICEGYAEWPISCNL